MSKLVRAINVMISNQDKITRAANGAETGENGGEIFFLYDNKHVWSIKESPGEKFKMWYYPDGPSRIEALLEYEGHDWENVKMVYYAASEFTAREALESVSELHRIVAEKLFGMDEVFEDIFSSDEDPLAD